MNEEETISLLWRILSREMPPLKSREFGSDPFSDDAAWIVNQRKFRLIVAKADMLVSDTDVPAKMSPKQIASKAVTSAVSDFAAKGVKPAFCFISLAIPRIRATHAFVSSIAEGFRVAAIKYGLRIIGGDTNSSRHSLIIDVPMFGFSDGSIVKRKGARSGDLIGVSGSFGLTSAGLAIALRKTKSQSKSFETRALKSVLEPEAKLQLGLAVSKHLTSCIDSSDGLAISLYHLAEASRADMRLNTVPIAAGVEAFAKRSNMNSNDLAFFGGEEYELVMTFPPAARERLEGNGIITIGKVSKCADPDEPKVYLGTKKIQRKGWIHNQ